MIFTAHAHFINDYLVVLLNIFKNSTNTQQCLFTVNANSYNAVVYKITCIAFLTNKTRIIKNVSAHILKPHH